MIQEFEQAVLTEDLPEYGLVAGDVGTVVDITTDGKHATLEFFNFAGETIAVALVEIHQVRPLNANEVIHARPRGA
ncbi:MAG: DUF4926 domain-containing protein [Chloroflexi bacterium]|nr:MAG: DUF4926 domain-containing protein [Chloroflexota bacterium]